MAESGEITTTLYRNQRPKFGNVKKTYNGFSYHSGMEARYAQLLDLLMRAKNPKDRVIKWERQIKIPLSAHGVHICNHYVDFKVWFLDGRVQLHEVKGFPDKAYPIKRKLMLVEYPDIDYRVYAESKGGEFYEIENFSRPR